MEKTVKEYLYEVDSEQTLREVVLRCLKNGEEKISLLNVACEYRLTPDFLTDIVDEKQVFGVEINPEIVAKNPHIRLCDVNSDRLPFHDDSFDVVLSIWGMEHFQTENIFHEANRILKPGGMFVFVAPNVWNPIFFINHLFGERLARFYYKWIMRSWYTPHKAYYRFNSFTSVRRAAQRSGLFFEQITYGGPSNILGYFSFSPFLQNLVKWGEKLLLTNFLFYRLKPCVICVLRKV